MGNHRFDKEHQMHNLLRGAAALAITGLAALAIPTTARAEIEYPYCAGGREGSGGCMYATLDQCRAFISGAGGSCYSNPRYSLNTAPAPRPRASRRR
jgi:hypothetical protein